MKKLLVLSLLLFSFFASAQDYQFIERSKNLLSQDLALQLSKEIVANSNPELRLYKFKDFPKLNKFKVVYVPAHLKDSDIENHNVSDADKLDFVSILFYIDSATKYRLLEVESKYDYLFPIWKRYYNPASDHQTLIDDYNGKRLQQPDKNIHYLFQQNGKNWIIRS